MFVVGCEGGVRRAAAVDSKSSSKLHRDRLKQKV